MRMPERGVVEVSVPASTSNLGSGFDTLGLAVNLRLRLRAQFRPVPGVELAGDFSPAAFALAQEASAPWLGERGFVFHLSNEAPVGRGLGASAALRVAVIAACARLCGEPLSSDQLLQRAYALEAHPDNVSPAIFGGFTASGFVEGQVRCHRFEVGQELKLVTLVPHFELPTGEARKLLPESYSKSDTAHSVNRAALVVAAFAAKDYRILRGVFDDRLHQPYREKVLPQLSAVIRAGEEAGAIGGFLSGAGSGIICLALENEQEIGRAMHAAFPQSEIKLLSPENAGLTVSAN